MTISSELVEKNSAETDLLTGICQLAVTPEQPQNKEQYYVQKCGGERLFLSLMPGDPLTFYPELHLRDLDGRAVLLLSRIGFWTQVRKKTPNSKYLLQVEDDSFLELAQNSDYPMFSSSYFIRQGETVPGRVNVPLMDEECQAEYYLVCLQKDRKRFERLYRRVREDLI